MKKNRTKNISNQHDQFFRTVMADRRVAQDFLIAHLPQELREQINFEYLELQPRSFINDVRKESEIDILFKTTIAGQEAYLYLLVEHQSKPDKLMPFRMLKYTCNIIDQYLQDNQTKTIPFIYSFVVYHGKCLYPYSMDINELVHAPPNLVERYFLKPCQLIDLNCIDDEVLKQHTWSGVMEFALKHIFERDILPHLKNVADLMHQLTQVNGQDYVAIVLQYFLERSELSNKDAFFHLIDTTISHEIGEKIMSLAERLKDEGKLEGKLESKLEIAKEMLLEGCDPIFIAKITKLPIEKIKELQK